MNSFTHSLADELRRAAAQAPDSPFIRMLAGEWSYGEVDRQSDAVAAGLYAQGVRQGHNVSLMLPNCIEFALAWFALAKLGAVCAPLNTAFRGQALAHAIDLVESRLLIVHASLWPQLAEVRAGLATVREIRGRRRRLRSSGPALVRAAAAAARRARVSGLRLLQPVPVALHVRAPPAAPRRR